jgi:hypothetical protein
MEWMEYTINQLNWYLGIQDKINELQEMINSMDEDITCSRVVYTDSGIVVQKSCVFEQVWAREQKRMLYQSGMERLKKDEALFTKVLSKLPSILKVNLFNHKYNESTLKAFFDELEKHKVISDSEKALRSKLKRIEKVAMFMS